MAKTRQNGPSKAFEAGKRKKQGPFVHRHPSTPGPVCEKMHEVVGVMGGPAREKGGSAVGWALEAGRPGPVVRRMEGVGKTRSTDGV